MAITDIIWNGAGFSKVDADTLDGLDSSELTPRSQLIPENVDLNNYTEERMYYCPLNAMAQTLRNCPTAQAFSLFVQRHAGVNQILIEFHPYAFKIFTRNFYDNNWSDWQRIYTTMDKPTPAEIGAIPTSASCNKNWNWSGQGGQPTWLWGGEDGTNMYVYNPRNFSVSSCDTARHLVMPTGNYGTPIEIGQYIDFHQAGTNTDYSVRLTGTAGALTCSGTFSATKVYNAVWNDYAELFEKESDDLTAGDILAWGDNGVVKATAKNKHTVVGVYSDSFGHLLGGEEGKSEEENLEKFAPVGLAGRVYVKVIGKVKKGDFIVPSKIPGVGRATRKYRPGTVVGKALEDYNGNEVKRIQMLIMNI